MANDSQPELPLREPEGRHVQGGRLPHGRGGERGRRRAGQHGRRGRRLRQRRPPEPLRDELRRGVQRPLPQRRRPLHRRLVPLEDRRRAACPSSSGARPSSTTTTTACSDLIVVNGHVYPQMDQVPMGASAGLPAARSSCTTTAATGRSTEVAAQFGPVLTDLRVSRGLAVGDLDNDGRLDVVVNDLDGAPAGPAQRARRRRPLADRRRSRARAGTPTRIGAVVSVKAGALEPDALRAERDELHLAGRHAPALRPRRGRRRRTSSRCAGPTAP